LNPHFLFNTETPGLGRFSSEVQSAGAVPLSASTLVHSPPTPPLTEVAHSDRKHFPSACDRTEQTTQAIARLAPFLRGTRGFSQEIAKPDPGGSRRAESSCDSMPTWEIERKLQSLLGANVRVCVDYCSPPRWNSELEHLISTRSLVLRDNSQPTVLPVFFEGKLVDYRRQIGVGYASLEPL
jgi:hypothetical protein